MNNELYISSYCSIKNNTVSVNGKEVFFKEESLSFKEFSKNVYKFKELNFPKFFKMDNLCKLSFLATEFVFDNNEIHPNTAIVFTNNASSLDTDRKHQESIQDKDSFFPSPAIFVYTLPNIAVGEISIKHKLQSENAFFVSEKFNNELLHSYTNVLIGNKKTNNVLCGWVNFDQNKYEAFIYLVSGSGTIPHTKEHILKLYNI